MGSSLEIDWHGERLELLADRAVHWPAGNTLFVADPHFGKATAFRTVGIAVPGDCCAESCSRLSELIADTDCERLVVLGDFLHSSWGRSTELEGTLIAWRKRHSELMIDLVRGNHDLHAGDPWPKLRINCHTEPWRLAPWTCRHEPGTEYACLAGHLHPAVSLAGARAPCFWVQQQQLTLPAFGEFTGTHVIHPSPTDRVIVTDGNDLIEISSTQVL